MASRITYLAGLLSRSKDSQLLVVSHAYELFTPLHDLANRLSDAGHVGLAYFGSLLDHRYRQTGILESHNVDRLEFFDLDPYISVLTSGAVAVTADKRSTAGTTVFSKFKF